MLLSFIDLNSNTPANSGTILYLVSAIAALAVILILGACVVITVAFTCLIRKQLHKNETEIERAEETGPTYEEINEFRQISSIIDTSKNLAYCQVTGNQ